MAQKLLWGIIGTGAIAKTFARALPHSKTGELLAVGSRSREKAESFGAEFGVGRRYESYEALLADRDVQAVYISTPHPMHAQWAIAAARAGKHILCEKPLTMNRAEAEAVIAAARAADVFLMEAFMYRCHPQTARVVQLIRERAIGEVRMIQATFGFHAPYDEESRILKRALGGGGILDIGCYCVSAARLIAGAAAGKDFEEPIEVAGYGHLGRTGVDEWAVTSLRFPGDIVAQLAAAVLVNLENTVKVFGSEGDLTVLTPWTPSREGGTTKIVLQRRGSRGPEEIEVRTDEWLFAIEADTVAANLEERQASVPAMSWADTLGNMATLDRWRACLGLTYEADGGVR